MTETQRCPRCDQHKPLEDYHPDKWGKRGHYCRECVLDYRREWRKARGQVSRAEAGARRRRQCAVQDCYVWPGGKRRYCTEHAPALSEGYRATHKRIGKIRGKASTHTCIHCGSQAEHWAYDHTDPNEITGPTDRGIVVSYSLDPTHYLPLCRPCHIAFDDKGDARGDASRPQPKRVSNW